MFTKIKGPLLLIAAVVMLLAMLRLGVWQLDRAEQKQGLLDQRVAESNLPEVALGEIADQLTNNDSNFTDNVSKTHFRYRKVRAQGRYLADKSIYVDNQVVDGQVGYRVFTPLLLTAAKSGDSLTKAVLINRGWIGVGESRATLPAFDTEVGDVVVYGRLNTPPAKPPLWSEDYSVAQGQVWAYLPIADYASQMGLSILPLVIELAPQAAPDQQFKIDIVDIGDEWVAKHKGYAFQWFSMAFAFFVACVVLVVYQRKK